MDSNGENVVGALEAQKLLARKQVFKADKQLIDEMQLSLKTRNIDSSRVEEMVLNSTFLRPEFDFSWLEEAVRGVTLPHASSFGSLPSLDVNAFLQEGYVMRELKPHDVTLFLRILGIPTGVCQI